MYKLWLPTQTLVPQPTCKPLYHSPGSHIMNECACHYSDLQLDGGHWWPSA